MSKSLSSAFTFGLLVIAAVMITRLVMGPSEAPTPAALQGVATLEQAIEQGRDEGKVVFAVATASWCGPCQSYKKGALADEGVQAWINDNAVGIMIDVDANRADADRLQISAIPATFVIKDGTIVEQFTGPVPTDRLLTTLASYAR